MLGYYHNIYHIHIFSAKLDSNTSVKWEESHNSLPDLPTLDEFSEFLKNLADVSVTLFRTKKDNDKNINKIEINK